MVAKHRDEPKPPPQMSHTKSPLIASHPTKSHTKSANPACHSTPRPTKSHANSSASSLHTACLFFPTADDGNLTSQCSAIRVRAPEEARLRGILALEEARRSRHAAVSASQLSWMVSYNSQLGQPK